MKKLENHELLRKPTNTYNTLCQLLNQEIEEKTAYSEFLDVCDVKSSVKQFVTLNNTTQFILLGIAVSEMLSKLVRAIGLLISALISDIACIMMDLILGIDISITTVIHAVLHNAYQIIASHLSESMNRKITFLFEQAEKEHHLYLCYIAAYTTGISVVMQFLINMAFGLLDLCIGVATASIFSIVAGIVGGMIDGLMSFTFISTNTERFIENISSVTRKPIETVSSITQKPLETLSETASKVCGFWFPKTNNPNTSMCKDIGFAHEAMSEIIRVAHTSR